GPWRSLRRSGNGRPLVVLGINVYHGDAAAVLLRDGELLAAVEEERFRRVKHWAGFPAEAVRGCLTVAGVAPEAVEHCAISRDPPAHLWRQALFALRRRPSVRLLADRARNASHVGDTRSALAEGLGLRPADLRVRIHHVEHHPAHLASAFFVSPFEDAAVCAIDGFGDFVSTSLAHGQ